MEPAILETYNFTPASAKGSGFELAWEAKSIHGQEAGKGLRAAFAPHSSKKSLVLSYTAKTDVQIFSNTGSQLAGVNISGRVFGHITETVAIVYKDVRQCQMGYG